MPSWLKTVGVVDGVVCAALVALGQYMPAWAPYTTGACEVLGVLGTVLGGFALKAASAPAASK